ATLLSNMRLFFAFRAGHSHFYPCAEMHFFTLSSRLLNNRGFSLAIPKRMKNTFLYVSEKNRRLSASCSHKL
ncbi:MAG: hypothetical protein KH828_13015, partial [Clostridiales bacterium]|nr:hypothetical protein [Clostridiales bacterium]